MALSTGTRLLAQWIERKYNTGRFIYLNHFGILRVARIRLGPSLHAVPQDDIVARHVADCGVGIRYNSAYSSSYTYFADKMTFVQNGTALELLCMPPDGRMGGCWLCNNRWKTENSATWAL